MPYRKNISEFKVGDFLRFTRHAHFLNPLAVDDGSAIPPDVYPGEFAIILKIKPKPEPGTFHTFDCEILLLGQNNLLPGQLREIRYCAMVVESVKDLKHSKEEMAYRHKFYGTRK